MREVNNQSAVAVDSLNVDYLLLPLLLLSTATRN